MLASGHLTGVSPTLDADIASVVLGCRENVDDALTYIENLLYIKTEKGTIVTIALNQTQKDILRRIYEMRAAHIPVRILVLKARREGVSTFMQALMFMLTVTAPNRNAWVIAHDVDSTAGLFAMSELMLDYLPEQLTPMIRHRDKKRIKYENPDQIERKDPERAGLRSMLYVDQAKNARAGRSSTITYLHASEVAFWGKDGPETMLSVLQSVSDDWDTMVVMETTANGVSDAAGFHDLWKQNYQVPGAAWVCLFFPWFIHPPYVREVDPSMCDASGNLILQEDPDGEMREDLYRFDFNLTDEQLVWRRWRMKEKCGNDVGKFMQEYPATPEEAFVTSGRPWYDRAGLEAIGKSVRAPKRVGMFRVPQPLGWSPNPREPRWRTDHFHPVEVRRRQAIVEFDENAAVSDCWIWNDPQPGREYLVSVDSAEGSADGDFSAIRVREKETLEDCAEFMGYIGLDLLTHLAAMFCQHYNRAYCIYEVNSSGTGFMVGFSKLWNRIYYRESFDEAVQKITWKAGFRTNSDTRHMITVQHQDLVREQALPTYSSRLFGQMQTFVKDTSGIPRAGGKSNHDDLVLADCFIPVLKAQRPASRVAHAPGVTTLDDDREFQKHRRKTAGTAKYF